MKKRLIIKMLILITQINSIILLDLIKFYFYYLYKIAKHFKNK